MKDFTTATIQLNPKTWLMKHLLIALIVVTIIGVASAHGAGTTEDAVPEDAFGSSPK